MELDTEALLPGERSQQAPVRPCDGVHVQVPFGGHASGVLEGMCKKPFGRVLDSMCHRRMCHPRMRHDACAMDACAIDACAINACASNAARRAWLGQRWWRSLQRAALRTTRRRRTSQTRMRSSHLPPPPPPLAPPGQAVTARRMDGGGRGVGRAGMRAAARCGGRGKPGARGCSGACSVPGSSPALFTVLLLPPVFPFLLLILIRMPIPIRIRIPTRILLLITYQYQY